MRFNRINSGRSIPTTNYDTDSRVVTYHGFNRINSGRSIPTISVALFCLSMFSVFQSYQFMQINPDQGKLLRKYSRNPSFNRINSCRSIPTWELLIIPLMYFSSFNRINSGRSIPTS